MLRDCPFGLLVARGPSIASFSIDPGRADHRDALWEVWEEDVYRVDALGDLAGRVVIDIGAHIGSFAILCASRGARVLAIEPFPEAYELLLSNLSGNALASVVLPVPVAVVEASGPAHVPMVRYSDSGMGVIAPRVDAVDVPTLSPSGLAGMIRQLGPEFDDDTPVALLKVDIEGAEHRLFGCPQMADLLSRCERVAIETHPGPALGPMIETLLATHHVDAFGRPAAGGMVYAHRY